MGRASNRKKVRRIQRKLIAAMATVVKTRPKKKSWYWKGLNQWPQGAQERARRLVNNKPKVNDLGI